MFRPSFFQLLWTSPSKTGVVRKILNFESLETRSMMATDSAAGIGLLGQYFSDSELRTIAFSQLDNSLNFNWNALAPSTLPVDNFSARWTGEVEATASELYTFRVDAEGGVRLRVNGLLLVDQWNANTLTNATGTIELVSGRRYELSLEYRETSGPASVSLRWSSPSTPEVLVPTSRLHASERGTIGRTVWSPIAGSSVSDLTSNSAFPNSPASTGSLSQFAFSDSTGQNYGERIAGLLHPPKTGLYKFMIAGDESAQLWLSNSPDSSNRRLIAFVASATAQDNYNQFPQQRSVDVPLVAGESYYIESLRKQSDSSGHLSVAWQIPGESTPSIIPGYLLSPIAPTVKLFVKQSYTSEGSPLPATFRIVREGMPLTSPLIVHYTTSGTATSGSDYTSLPGTITIPAGQSSVILNISATSDAAAESTENVVLELKDAAGYRVGYKSERTAIATIQDSQPSPVGGVSLLASGSILNNFVRYGGSFSEQTDPIRGNVIQANIPGGLANIYDAAMYQVYQQPVSRGDVLFAEFLVRSSSGNASLQLVAERDGPPFTLSVYRTISVSNEWSLVQVPFQSAESYSNSTFQGRLSFQLGQQAQVIELANIRLVNYGPSRNLQPASGWGLLNIVGNNNVPNAYGNTTEILVTGQPFTSATRITTTTTPPNGDFWRLQYGGRSEAKVSSGNQMKVEFYARGAAGTNPTINVALQRTDTFAPLSIRQILPSISPDSLSVSIVTPSTWTKYEFLVTSTGDFANDGLEVYLKVGFALQTVEIADFKWTNLSATTDVSKLPLLTPAISYGGREGDASWRSSATSNIDADRRSNLSVNVYDANGFPVDGAVVSLRQKEHGFRFGTAVNNANGALAATPTPSAAKYQGEILRLFNSVVIENALKWPDFAADRPGGLAANQWAADRGLNVKGHNILWPSRENMPQAVWSTYDSLLAGPGGQTAATNHLRAAILARIEDAVSTFSTPTQKLLQWDVVNEPFANNAAINVLGSSAMVEWFQRVKQVNPNVQRVLNEYDIFSRNGKNTANRSNFDGWLTLLKANNAIEMMGEESHYTDGNLTDIDVLGQLISSYNTTFNIPISISEFDFNSTNRQLQADYMRDYLTMSFSKSAVREFYVWGFWSGNNWLPEAALYNADFSIRPNGQVFEDLVFGNWWTDTRGTSQAGVYSAEVFQGDFQIEVRVGDKLVATKLHTVSNDGSINIELPGLKLSATNIVATEGVSTTVTARLNQAPLSNVTIALSSNAQVQISPATLVFTTTNWNTPQNLTVTPVEDYTVEGSHVSPVGYALSSSDSRYSVSPPNSIRVQIIDGAAPLSVSRMVVGNGTAQRSVIKQVAVEFSGLAALQPGAFIVERIRPNNAGFLPVTVSFTTADLNGKTTATLIFSGPQTNSTFGTLVDGNYRLTIDSSKAFIRGTTSRLDGDKNLAPGGNYLFGQSPSDLFFALFGDINGDGFVGFTDFAAFRFANGKSKGQTGFDSGFDYDLNDVIGFTDFAKFRSNNGKSR